MWSDNDLKQFEKDAMFWSPDAPDEQFFGRIMYSMEEGIHVHVFKSATMAERMALWSDQSVDSEPLVLHADIQDIGAVTLYDGFIKNQKLGSSGPATQIMYFNHGLLGFHSNAPEEELFKRVSLYVRNLEAWLGVNPFRFPTDGVDIREERTIVWSRPDPNEVEIRGLGKASINWVAIGPPQSVTQSVATIESTPYLALEFEQPVPYEQASRRVNCLLDMIETVADSCFPFESLRYTSSTRSQKVGNSDKTYPLSAAVIGCRTSQEKLTTLRYPQDALLSLRDINDFESAVEKWYSICTLCEPAIKAYTSLRLDKSGYAENRFFMLASIAESLHRDLNPSSDVTFRQRIKCLLNDAAPIILDAVGDTDQQVEFLSQVTDWRNEQAHKGQPKTKYSNRDGIDYVRTAAKLKVIIDFQLLLQIGIAPERISERMRACHRYWFYANNKTWRWQMYDEHTGADHEPAASGS